MKTKSLIGAAVLAASILASTGTIYPQTMIVTGIDRAADTVEIETAAGHIYAFYGAEDYETGDVVSAILYNNLTPDVTDDEILAVRYAGWSIEYEMGVNR